MKSLTSAPKATTPTTINAMPSSYSMADGGYIDSETQKTSEQQQEIIMPEFNGRIVEWFQKAGDRVSKGEAILCVESVDKDKNGFRVNMDIPATQNGYLAARYKLEGDMVDAKQVLAVLVPDQKSLAAFVPHSPSGSGGGAKSWWSTPYEPGRPDPFTAKSPLGDDEDDIITVPPLPSPTTTPSLSEQPVSVIKGFMSTPNKNSPQKMVEIAPSPSDPFQYGTNSGRNSYDGQVVPPQSRVPTTSTDTFDYGQNPQRARHQPPINGEIFERRRKNNRGDTSTTDVDTVQVSWSDVTSANADAVRERPRNTDNLKSAAVPLYGSDEQTSISSDDSRVRYANGPNRNKKPRKPRRKPSSSAAIDPDVIPLRSPSYGSDVQSSIPASTNAFFQRPPKLRQRRKTRKQVSATFQPPPPTSFYTGDEYPMEDPSVQSIFPPQRTSLPTQSGGSMSLSENSLPTRSNLDMQQAQSSSPYFFQSDEQVPSIDGMDLVDYLETRGMRDNSYNAPMPMRIQQQPLGQQLELQQQQLQWRRQAVWDSPHRRSIITRAKNRTPPTEYDVAASTVGGTLLGASIGIAGVLNPDLGLNILDPGQSAMLPPVLWATMMGTVGYAGGIADNDAGYSIRHVFSLGNSLKKGLKSFVHSARETVEKTANEVLRMVSGQAEPSPRIHHVTIKTRDIISAIQFYGLLGFESKSKFRVGQTRATWLDNVVLGAGRIELIEVPSDILEQGSTSSLRALDRVRNQDLLGWNHLTLDVSDLMLKKGHGSLPEFLAYLNEKSYNRFGKGLRLAVEPQKQAIDDRIYNTAFLFDPDGSMIQLQHLTNERVEDYRISPLYYGEPTGGQGLVDQSGNYQDWW